MGKFPAVVQRGVVDKGRPSMLHEKMKTLCLSRIDFC